MGVVAELAVYQIRLEFVAERVRDESPRAADLLREAGTLVYAAAENLAGNCGCSE